MDTDMQLNILESNIICKYERLKEIKATLLYNIDSINDVSNINKTINDIIINLFEDYISLPYIICSKFKKYIIIKYNITNTINEEICVHECKKCGENFDKNKNTNDYPFTLNNKYNFKNDYIKNIINNFFRLFAFYEENNINDKYQILKILYSNKNNFRNSNQHSYSFMDIIHSNKNNIDKNINHTMLKYVLITDKNHVTREDLYNDICLIAEYMNIIKNEFDNIIINLQNDIEINCICICICKMNNNNIQLIQGKVTMEQYDNKYKFINPESIINGERNINKNFIILNKNNIEELIDINYIFKNIRFCNIDYEDKNDFSEYLLKSFIFDIKKDNSIQIKNNLSLEYLKYLHNDITFNYMEDEIYKNNFFQNIKNNIYYLYDKNLKNINYCLEYIRNLDDTDEQKLLYLIDQTFHTEIIKNFCYHEIFIEDLVKILNYSKNIDVIFKNYNWIHNIFIIIQNYADKKYRDEQRCDNTMIYILKIIIGKIKQNEKIKIIQILIDCCEQNQNEKINIELLKFLVKNFDVNMNIRHNLLYNIYLSYDKLQKDQIKNIIMNKNDNIYQIINNYNNIFYNEYEETKNFLIWLTNINKIDENKLSYIYAINILYEINNTIEEKTKNKNKY
jgi:hypothetical protein